jgi:hypothetical protein
MNADVVQSSVIEGGQFMDGMPIGSPILKALPQPGKKAPLSSVARLNRRIHHFLQCGHTDMSKLGVVPSVLPQTMHDPVLCMLHTKKTNNRCRNAWCGQPPFSGFVISFGWGESPRLSLVLAKPPI